MRLLLFCILIVVALCTGALAADADDGSSDDHGLPHAVAYDVDTFHAKISLHPHFVMFYAPWFVFMLIFCCGFMCLLCACFIGISDFD